MVTLPKNTLDTQDRINKGVDMILTDISNQIVKSQKENKHTNSVAIIKEKGTEHSDSIYDKDLIDLAMQEVIKQGYYVWYYTNYQKKTSYWITQTNNCPHPWYIKYYV